MSTNEDIWGDDDLDELNINELEKILDNPLPKAAFETLRKNEQYQGFHNNAGNIWMYPSNLPMRAYQHSITHAALFKNTLVVLPTGLGKTFIAAVVMYNIYRWYPAGKVIFMAPTRPLVAQQINACNQIMPFPLDDTIELTGKLQRDKRMTCWREKRVFFATPQALQSDMLAQNDAIPDFPFQQVKLIVVDEAHRAKGRYSYVEVVQALHQRNKYFRVLALSATPGRTMEDVVEVVRNLFISHLEVRWDTSIDVIQFVHRRSIKKIVIKLSEEIKRVRDDLIKIIDPYMRQLIEADIISSSHQHITKNYLIMEQKRFRERSMQQSHPQQSAVSSNFSICISLYHALELLERHGLRVFLNYFEDDEDGRPKFVLSMNPSLRHLVEQLRCELGPNPFDISAHTMTNGRIAEVPKDLDFGHPKFEEARKCILEHFEQNPESRAIVFCEYRESVMMIYRLLLQHVPVLKPKCFVGQGGTAGALRALSQKQQIQIMNDFRAGKSNILVATSIGEEGIDVGEVDLIVCFDINTSNPVRFVQRIGRTGRQRRGHVVMLLTEGKEAKLLEEVLANKDQTNKKILRSSMVQAALYKQSPRMVPTEFNPECVQIHVRPRTPPVDGNKKKQRTTEAEASKRKKPLLKSKEKPVANTQDLRKFFKKQDANETDTDDFESAAISPVKITQQSMARVEKLFQHLQPCTSSNTQLLAELAAEEEIVNSQAQSTQPTQRVKLETQHLKRLNKFLKSSADALLPPQHEQLLTHLNSNNCTKAAKLFMLQRRFKEVREICEQMEILQALNADEDAHEMSTQELEIRQTYEGILCLFESTEALKRFLEDAEMDAVAAKKRKARKAANINDSDMTWSAYQQAKQKIFAGLDLQGPSWDSFDYRQEALKQTKAYHAIIAQKQIEKQPKTMEPHSMVFNALPCGETTAFAQSEDLEDMTLNSLANVVEADSKYCSQWLADGSFQTHHVNAKSTPINGGALAKAFERQKCKKQITARRQLETVKEPAFESDDEDDVIFLPLGNEVEKNEQSKKAEEAKPSNQSFMQCQQSTPVQPKLRTVTSNEKNLEHVLDFDIEQAFSETFTQEIEISNEKKTQNSSGNSLKEHAKPLAVREKINANLATKPRMQPPPTTSLFEMLETKPVNSVLTPKRSFTVTTPQRVPSSNEQPNSNRIPVQTFSATPPQSKQQSRVQALEDACSPQGNTAADASNVVYNESPKNRPQTSTKPYEKSPSVFSTFTKGLQRLEKRRQMRANSVENNHTNAAVATLTKSATVDNSDLDSPLVGKRKRKVQRKIVESDTDGEEPKVQKSSPVMMLNSKQQSSGSNSDDDFMQVEASPKHKRRCLSKQQNSKPKLRPARLCEFFNDEAEKSGNSGHSEEEEHENTLGDFVCDSVIVNDAAEVDEEDDAPSATQMQAIYLRSVNSPNQRRRPVGFKIPAPHAYDINVYSQAVPVEPSHYDIDSFVVNEEDEVENLSANENTTLCPLERAERILKERRRREKRRRCAEQVMHKQSEKRSRKCYQMEDDSSDDGCGG